MKSRREFLTTSMKAGIALPLVGSSFLEQSYTKGQPPKSLKILILGGTGFLGPQQIAYALGRGHSVTTFTRGKTVPTTHEELFKQVESLEGDRANNLEALKGKKWDVVIDNSGYRAKWTEDSARLLKDQADLYLYTSSTGVYYPYLNGNIKEDTRLVLTVPEGITEEQKMEYDYGVMKANSEILAKREFGADRTIVVRPTYMMGPGDRTDRFTYWPVRLQKGGDILVPGKADDPVQYIDVRDVAEWMIRLLEQTSVGTFNATGPASDTGMHAFVYGAHAAFSSSANFVMIPDYEFLQQHKIPYLIPWIMPTGDNFASALVNKERGIKNGLTYRPLAESVRDIYEWWYSDAVPEERRQRLASGEDSLMAREASVIASWKKQNKN